MEQITRDHVHRYDVIKGRQRKPGKTGGGSSASKNYSITVSVTKLAIQHPFGTSYTIISVRFCVNNAAFHDWIPFDCSCLTFYNVFW